MSNLSEQVPLGKWRVEVDLKDRQNFFTYLENRPAISYGEKMFRVAGMDFEMWWPLDAVGNCNVTLEHKVGVFKMIEQVGLDVVRAHARAMKQSDDEEVMTMGRILESEAARYEACLDFITEAAEDA
jgi:hypothetical protein